MASILKEDADDEVVGLTANVRANFPDEPERNVDREAHGRIVATDACVTVAMWDGLKGECCRGDLKISCDVCVHFVGIISLAYLWLWLERVWFGIFLGIGRL